MNLQLAGRQRAVTAHPSDARTQFSDPQAASREDHNSVLRLPAMQNDCPALPSTPPAGNPAVQVLGSAVRPKQKGLLPFWCSDGVEPLLQMVSSDCDSEECRPLLRRRALVQALIEDGGLDWGSADAASAVERIRHCRTRDSSDTAAAAGGEPDFCDSLVVISFGAAGGGFQLSQDLRHFMLSYLQWDSSLIYHDYASLVGHPHSRLVTGADGVTKQLNENWNIYFANALGASPVMVVVASESWCGSAWCALEKRQRMEVLVAKQAPGGPEAYTPTAASDPAAAGAAGAASDYLRRQVDLEAELENVRQHWHRSARSMQEVNESVYRAVAFGNQRGRCEVFLFTDDPNGSSASAELRQVHASVPESQRFYYLPHCGMSSLECALELHSLCVRVTELIDDQANRESIGGGEALYSMITSEEIAAAQWDVLLRQQLQHRSGLWRLRQLAHQDAMANDAEAQAERSAALMSSREDAIARGLVFDTGPCPF